MSYILGFMFADGNIVNTKRNTWFWSIQITDKPLLESIKKTIGSTHKISKRKPIERNKSLYRLQIGSKEMCEDLIKLGLSQKKSLTMKFPDIDKEYLPDFLRGYFDGDGHVWIGNVQRKNRDSKVIITGFTSGSLPFLNSLKSTLSKSFDLSGGSIVKKDRGYELKYSINDSLKIYKTMYNMQYGRLYLPRKKRIFEKFIAMRT